MLGALVRRVLLKYNACHYTVNSWWVAINVTVASVDIVFSNIYFTLVLITKLLNLNLAYDVAS